MKTLITTLFLSALLLATGSALGQNNVLYAWRNQLGQAGNFGSADGTNGDARFYYPHGVAAGSAGDPFVADIFKPHDSEADAAGDQLGGDDAGGQRGDSGWCG